MKIRDLYLAAFLCVKFPLKNHAYENASKQNVFEFEDSPELALSVEDYRTSNIANVSAKTFAAEIRNLKALIHG